MTMQVFPGGPGFRAEDLVPMSTSTTMLMILVALVEHRRSSVLVGARRGA